LGGGTRSASPGLRAAAAAGATSLLMVLVAWGSLIGPDEVFTGPGPTPSTVTPTTPTTPPAEDTFKSDAEKIVREAEPPLWLKLLVWTFEILVLAGFAAFFAFLLTVAVRAVKRRARRFEEVAEIDFVTLDEPSRIAAAITEDAAEQDAVLREGEPRNAIVAAWRRFEIQGERAGVEREPAETSSEFALRMLERVDAESHAVNELAELYSEARFSQHPIDESHRAAALAALARIRRSLGVRT
jgi:hypothetical protein